MTAATARKTAPRKKAATPRKKPIEDIPMPEIEVLELNSADMEVDEPDWVEIFRLDGKPYHIDRNVGAGMSLRVIKALRKGGEESAVATVLMELLGEEGFDALANFRGIRARHLAQVLMSCNKAILGDREAGPKA